MFLQETHKTKSFDPLFKTARYPTQIQAHGTSKSRGVTILLSARIRTSIEAQDIDPLERYLFLNVTMEGEPLTLASVYAPNKNQLQFLTEVSSNLSSFSKGPIILGGDLNSIIDPSQDSSGTVKRKGLRGEARGERHNLGELLRKFRLTDLWCELNLGVRDYSYFSHRHRSLSRIDFLLVSEEIQQNFIDSDMRLRIWSDHASVEARFYPKNLIPHTKRWRFN